MACSEYDFYKNTYKGILIENGDEYAYFAERAGEQLAPFANKLPDTEEAKNAYGRCKCRIADILYGDFKQSKNGVSKLSSESVAGYYSVSYATPDSVAIKSMIKNAIVLYLGRFICGAKKFTY